MPSEHVVAHRATQPAKVSRASASAEKPGLAAKMARARAVAGKPVASAPVVVSVTPTPKILEATPAPEAAAPPVIVKAPPVAPAPLASSTPAPEKAAPEAVVQAPPVAPAPLASSTPAPEKAAPEAVVQAPPVAPAPLASSTPAPEKAAPEAVVQAPPAAPEPSASSAPAPSVAPSALPEVAPAPEIASVDPGAPGRQGRKIAIVMTKLDVKDIAGLREKSIVLAGDMNVSDARLKAAFATAGAEGAAFMQGDVKDADEVESGAVAAAILAVVTPEVAGAFPEIPGYRLLRVEVAPEASR